MYEIWSQSHYLGHCGLEGHGSQVGGECEATGFETREAAQAAIEVACANDANFCERCGRYTGTVSDPTTWYVKRA
jgi:hypothetical protein